MRTDSVIGAELKELVAVKGEPTLEEKNAAELNVQVAKGGLENVRNYSIPDRDPFVDCLEMLRKEAGTRPAYLVFDNLERMIGNTKLLDELADFVSGGMKVGGSRRFEIPFSSEAFSSNPSL